MQLRKPQRGEQKITCFFLQNPVPIPYAYAFLHSTPFAVVGRSVGRSLFFFLQPINYKFDHSFVLDAINSTPGR